MYGVRSDPGGGARDSKQSPSQETSSGSARADGVSSPVAALHGRVQAALNSSVDRWPAPVSPAADRHRRRAVYFKISRVLDSLAPIGSPLCAAAAKLFATGIGAAPAMAAFEIPLAVRARCAVCTERCENPVR
jgi:hypothetical protein